MGAMSEVQDMVTVRDLLKATQERDAIVLCISLVQKLREVK